MILAAVGVLLLPGAMLTRGLGMHWPLAWTTGPALTVLMAAALATLYAAVGIPWTRGSALLGSSAVIVLVALIVRKVAPGRVRPVASYPGPLDVTVLGAFLLVLTVRTTSAREAMGGLGRINNSFDAFFHTAAIAFIRDTGDGSLLTGSAPLYSGAPQVYPLAFDAIAALVPGDPVSAANAMVLVLVPISFLGTAGLIRAVLPAGFREKSAMAPILAGASTLLIFRSADALGPALGLWPNLLSVALLPSAVTVLVHAVGAWTDANDTGRGLSGLHLVLVVAGAVVAHPSAFFTLVVGMLSLALAVVVLYPTGFCSRRTGIVAAVMLLLGGMSFVVVNVLLQWMDVTPPPTGGLVGLLADTAADRPRIAVVPREALLAAPWWALSAFGAGWSLRSRSLAGLTASAAVASLLGIIVLGSSSRPVLGDLTNAWYGAPERVMPAVAIAVAVLVAFGVQGLLEARRTWMRRAAPAVVVAATVGALVVTVLPTRLPLMASMFDHESEGRYLAYVTVEEQQFIESISRELPADAVVLGDPWDGSPAFWTVGGVQVVYPTLASPGILDTRRVGLRGHLADRSAKVCGSLRRLGVTHLYTDSSEASGEVIARSRPEDPFPGLRKIKTDELVTVASDGPYTLYEFEPPC